MQTYCHRLVRAGVATAVAMPVLACSVLLDWSRYTGAEPGMGSDAMSGGLTCGTDQRCIPAPPASWEGPLAVYEGPGSGSVPSCTTGYSGTPVFDGNRGMLAPAATCSACSCGAPQGSACTPPMITFFSDGNCATACSSAQPLTSSTCIAPPCGASFKIDSPMASAGTMCTPSGGSPTLPPVTWSQVARACTPAAVPARGSCSADQLCLPSPASPFPPRLCVMQIGEATSCPGAGYIAGPYVYYGGQVADTRGCAQCSCGSATAASCSFPPVPPAGYRYLDPVCGAPMIPLIIPTSCLGLKGSNPFKLMSEPTLAPGSCQPAGGGPTGAATPMAPVTFCCTP